jgi:hypothetical protein
MCPWAPLSTDSDEEHAGAHRDVQKVLAGIVRTKTVVQTRKDALTTDRLEEAMQEPELWIDGGRLSGMIGLNWDIRSAQGV